MRYIAYFRVSTEEQSLGLDAQKAACQEYSRRHGAELHEIFTDEGLCGALSFEKRPGILNAIASLEKGDVLLVAKRDRLSRGDVLAMAMIEAGVARKGAKIVSTAGEGTESEDPASILMRRIVDAFGEYERLIIQSRTKSALATKKAKGECVGRVPFGHRLAMDGIRLEPCPHEQYILVQIGELKEQGLPIRDMAMTLNERKVFNRGGAWTKSSIHRIAQKVAQ